MTLSFHFGSFGYVMVFWGLFLVFGLILPLYKSTLGIRVLSLLADFDWGGFWDIVKHCERASVAQTLTVGCILLKTGPIWSKKLLDPVDTFVLLWKAVGAYRANALSVSVSVAADLWSLQSVRIHSRAHTISDSTKSIFVFFMNHKCPRATLTLAQNS